MNIGNKISSAVTDGLNASIKTSKNIKNCIPFDKSDSVENYASYFIFPNGKKVYDMTSALEEATGVKVLDIYG